MNKNGQSGGLAGKSMSINIDIDLGQIRRSKNAHKDGSVATECVPAKGVSETN